MTTMQVDEAQAMIPPGLSRMETGRIRNGTRESAEIVEVPVEYFDAVRSTVIEQMFLARDETLRSYPEVATSSIVRRLVADGVVDHKNAQHVRDLVELEIKRGIEHLAENARDRYATRLPISLRSLIPLISRRSST